MKHIGLLVLIVLPFLTTAQNAQEKFGKNRLQHKEFNWKYYSSRNFDVYFHQGGSELALEATKYLETQFDRLTDLIGYHPYSKTKVIVYNSIADLEQSNIGLNHNPFALGGETEFQKAIIEVAFTGTMSGFKDELVDKLSEMLINEMMFGGSLKDMFQNAMLMNLPEWFIKGVARYVSEGWSKEMDDYIRQLIKDEDKIKLDKLHGEEAALAGQSLWNFIVERYGSSNVSNILNYTRIIRNEEKSIAITLGLPFDRILKEWRQYYSTIDENIANSYATPEDSIQINVKDKYNLTAVKLSPEGTRLAYVLNERGRYKVKVRDLTTGNEFDAIKGGYKRYDQQVNYDMPLISWADENTLGVITQQNDEVIFTLFDAYTRSKLPRVLRKVDQVHSFDFNTNGRLAILSGYSGGKNDLFLISTRRDRIRRLFTDPFDDIDPIFMPNSNVIVFSSNRLTDTLATEALGLAETPTNYNLFAYHLDTTKNVLRRITNTVSRDVQPLATPDEDIFFLSDQNGITNLYRMDLASGIYKQVTNFDASIKDYDINFKTDNFVAIIPFRGTNELYLKHDLNLNREIFTPTTPRKQLLQAREYHKQKEKKAPEGKTFKEIINSRLEDQQQESDTVEVQEEATDKIDTDDYVFEDEAVETVSNATSIIDRYRKRTKEVDIKGPFDYQTRFSADYLVTSFLFDPLRGFSLLFETEINDLMENHQFTGSVLTVPAFDEGEISVRYNYLKPLIDLHGGFERETLLERGNRIQQLSRNTFFAGASIPFNVKTRLSLSPFFTRTTFQDKGERYPSRPPSYLPERNDEFLGIRSELVYDNSLTTGLNIISGTRGKASFYHWEGLDNKQNSFSRLQIDIRNYQPIYQEIVFAFRGFFGKYFGNNPKQYVLGGMDNWVLQKENLEGLNNPLAQTEHTNTDLLFLQYATPLRGFNHAALYGQNALLFNFELRLPLIRALHSGPISSNFLRNLQFVGFYDIGSSWTGKSPFDEENTISARQINQGNFEINIKDYRNPWLSSYGVGMRTLLFGYYMKFDLAWPIEDYDVNDPKFYITLGYDF
ncbi:MAG: translocation protein TolB [Candidatus Cyclobacteriaceae bacterium M2_1C_046]